MHVDLPAASRLPGGLRRVDVAEGARCVPGLAQLLARLGRDLIGAPGLAGLRPAVGARRLRQRCEAEGCCCGR